MVVSMRLSTCQLLIHLWVCKAQLTISASVPQLLCHHINLLTARMPHVLRGREHIAEQGGPVSAALVLGAGVGP